MDGDSCVHLIDNTSHSNNKCALRIIYAHIHWMRETSCATTVFFMFHGFKPYSK